MRAQTSTEFVILTTFMLLAFLVFAFFIQQKMIDEVSKKNDIIAQDILDNVVNEIRLAESVSDNYERTFTLPYSPEGLSYNIIINSDLAGSEIVITYDNKEKIYFLDAQINNASTLNIGNNHITKNNGIILITGG